MTAISNTATTLTTKGIREDLEDNIYRVAASKTPFTKNIGTAKAPRRSMNGRPKPGRAVRHQLPVGR
jgi:hypothetical protein